MSTFNQPRALQWAIESSKKGRVVILIIPATCLEKLKNLVISAVPAVRIRTVRDNHIEFTSRGEIHFRLDAQLPYGREVDVLALNQEGEWGHTVELTPPLLDRFALLELECEEM